MASELKAQKGATVRFETAPGNQMQIDFGDTKVWISGERVRVHLCVGTLGYSRRMHIRASPRQRQTDWFEGMEGAFLRFGGVPTEVVDGVSKARLNDDKSLVLVEATKRRPLQAAECRGCVLQNEDGTVSISL